jgi:ABC-2 type transport system ATP-binding protein
MKILEVKNIEKTLAKKKVLHKISFWVNAWEIYWFLWPNWAGKTTTMKCIMWLIEPESWEINIFWEKWLTLESKFKIGFMPENTYLYKHLTWKEFLKFNWKFFWLNGKKLDKKVEELLKRVGLENDWDKYLSEYSKWMLQRVWLAQSIINEPKLLFLDEPMSGLDPIWRKMVKDLLVSLRDEWTTIFFNTHILADVESICDRISIIHKWHMIVEGKEVSSIKWSLEDFFIEKVTNS